MILSRAKCVVKIDKVYIQIKDELNTLAIGGGSYKGIYIYRSRKN